MSDKNESKAVFTVVEIGGKSMWIRIGTAFVCKDGSLNVVLNCLPLNGKLQIRDKNSQS